MIHGAAVGGFAGAAGAAAFQGMNNLLNKTFTHQLGILTISGQPRNRLPVNTLSYMAGSTASQMTANIVNGRNPFKGVDYGFNLGLLYPLVLDVLRYSNHYNMHVAKKHMPNEEIVSLKTKSSFVFKMIEDERFEIMERKIEILRNEEEFRQKYHSNF